MQFNHSTNLYQGAVGGVFIAAGSSLLLYTCGSVIGISGILGSSTSAAKDLSRLWTLTYLAGLITAGRIIKTIEPQAFGDHDNASTLSYTGIVVAGLLTGIGTRMGNGCTSGHGICGLPRRSPRSLVAVLTFMTSGALTAYLAREFNLFHGGSPHADANATLVSMTTPTLVALGASYLIRSTPLVAKSTSTNITVGETILKHVSAFLCSLTVGAGLGISGMCNADRVIHFLDFSGPAGWDYSLMGVMGAGVMVNVFLFEYFSRSNANVMVSSICGKKERVGSMLTMGMKQSNLIINTKLVLGSFLFGIGWGLGGVCPGPAIVSLGASIQKASIFVPMMITGMMINDVVEEMLLKPSEEKKVN